MKWVTWENVGVDRMACAWLIKHRIDADAEFIFIPSTTTAWEADAEPFDLPGVRLTHRRGHCTFHTMLREYKLKDPILQRMAVLVDEADLVQEALVEPAAPGLDLICRGVRLISPDDQAALQLGYQLYDAVYAQLQKEMTYATSPPAPLQVGEGAGGEVYLLRNYKRRWDHEMDYTRKSQS